MRRFLASAALVLLPAAPIVHAAAARAQQPMGDGAGPVEVPRAAPGSEISSRELLDRRGTSASREGSGCAAGQGE